MRENSSIKNHHVSFPEVIEQPVMWGYHRDLCQANKYKAIVEANTGTLFSIVSRDYRLIRHEEAIDQVEDAIHETNDLGKYEIYTDLYNDGGRMQRKYIFSEIKVEIQPGDNVNLELQLFNSYDTSWPLIVLLGAFRIVCANGLVVGKRFMHLRKRHVYELGRIDLHGEVSTALERFSLQTDQWKDWANERLTDETHNKLMHTMKFGKNATEEIDKRVFQEAEDFYDNGFPIMSLWVFFNIITWYITHRAVSLNHRVEMEKRLRAALAKIKVK